MRGSPKSAKSKGTTPYYVSCFSVAFCPVKIVTHKNNNEARNADYVLYMFIIFRRSDALPVVMMIKNALKPSHSSALVIPFFNNRKGIKSSVLER